MDVSKNFHFLSQSLGINFCKMSSDLTEYLESKKIIMQLKFYFAREVYVMR